MNPVQRFKDWRQRRRQARASAITQQIDRISDTLPFYAPDDPRRTALESKRVSLWWDRNALYHKLKETHVRP